MSKTNNNLSKKRRNQHFYRDTHIAFETNLAIFKYNEITLHIEIRLLFKVVYLLQLVNCTYFKSNRLVKSFSIISEILPNLQINGSSGLSRFS